MIQKFTAQYPSMKIPFYCSDLHNIMKWCSTWLINLNYDKCKSMSFGNSTLPTRQYLMSTGEEDTLLIKSVSSLIWECFSLQISN